VLVSAPLRRDNTNPSRMRLTVGLGYVSAAMVAGLATVTPDPHPADHSVLRVAALVSLAAAVVMAFGDRVPFALLKLIAVTGAIVLNSVDLAVSDPVGPTLIFYVWPAFTSGYFCTRRERVTHYVVLALGLSAGLALSPAHDEALPLLSGISVLVFFVIIAVGVADLSTREDRLVEALRHAASTDPLTGLLNRRAFTEAFDGLIGAAGDRPLSVVLFDLDHFKLVNDRFGHDVGDEALLTFASTLNEARGEADLVARSGGEEFTVALPDRDAREAEAFARGVVRTLAERTRHTAVPLTVSAGVASLGGVELLGIAPSDALINAADQALYAAKEAGRDRVEVQAGLRSGPAPRAHPGVVR
jgi:diguanylate cyclase (GGDEF)-like protein